MFVKTDTFFINFLLHVFFQQIFYTDLPYDYNVVGRRKFTNEKK
jgi:hypothetical protein